MTTTLSYSQPLYYVHSGKAPVSSLVFALGSGLIGGAVLAVIYAYLILYIPLAGYVSFLLTFGFGFSLGWVVAKSLRWGSVRSQTVAIVISAIVGVVALYVAWAAWLYALLQQENAGVSLFEVVTSPLGMWQLMMAISENGAWTVSGITPTGIFLWLIWLVEAAIVVGAAVIFGKGAIGDPYCETCSAWTTGNDSALITAPGNPADAKAALERHDLAHLQTLGRADNANQFFKVDIHTCGHCKQFNTLTLSSCTLTMDNNGKPSVKASPIVKQLLVTEQEVAYIRDLNVAFATPEPPPAPEAQPTDAQDQQVTQQA